MVVVYCINGLGVLQNVQYSVAFLLPGVEIHTVCLYYTIIICLLTCIAAEIILNLFNIVLAVPI